MSITSPNPTVALLFGNAVNFSGMSTAAQQIVNVPNLSSVMQSALGVHVDDVKANEVVLLSLFLDDSGSIRGPNEEAVKDGANLVLNALSDAKGHAGTLAMVLQMNAGLTYGYTAVKGAPRITTDDLVRKVQNDLRAGSSALAVAATYGINEATVKLIESNTMTTGNFRPSGLTPMWDTMVVGLGSVVAKAQSFIDVGVSVRTITLLATDGGEYGSRNASAANVKSIIKGMNPEQHIVAAMGFDDGGTDFHAAFDDMGIARAWHLLPGASPSDVRKAFLMFSQSAARASQAAQTPGNPGGFAAIAVNGFTT